MANIKVDVDEILHPTFQDLHDAFRFSIVEHSQVFESMCKIVGAGSLSKIIHVQSLLIYRTIPWHEIVSNTSQHVMDMLKKPKVYRPLTLVRYLELIFESLELSNSHMNKDPKPSSEAAQKMSENLTNMCLTVRAFFAFRQKVYKLRKQCELSYIKKVVHREDYGSDISTFHCYITELIERDALSQILRFEFSDSRYSLTLLEKSFKLSQYVKKNSVEKLASLTGLSEYQVRTWFANRRRKSKK